ncbi:biotin--[acetyl-CoA-carboxylase] ligase [Mycolicibacterium palauense]|uniref:biotin--[acetyl-CoA-carboxylase] ligase n=1 Tax=Mycolicibacterium palauense TaxID=2034511 RepID=UPI000BFF1162|nr:biotin--[acetyl-CoA-carboxylase] ligase [Mycolicibacterium palauense]
MSAPDRPPLDTDRLRAALLAPATQWRRLDVVDETGSTNADLAARAAAGEDIAGTALLAEHQTAGRGRHGRRWSAPPRSQIALSVGVPVAGLPTDAWGWLPLLTGLAVVDAVREQCGVAARLKWPNDVLVGGGKLAGILAEVTHPGPVIVVGLGLNVSLTSDEAPDPVATSLAMLGRDGVDRTELAIAVLRTLHARIGRWRAARGADAQLVADYARASATIGTPVRAMLPGDAQIVGTATGVDASGRLLIDDGTRTVTVAAGDITHLRPAAPDG